MKKTRKGHMDEFFSRSFGLYYLLFLTKPGLYIFVGSIVLALVSLDSVIFLLLILYLFLGLIFAYFHFMYSRIKSAYLKASKLKVTTPSNLFLWLLYSPFTWLGFIGLLITRAISVELLIITLIYILALVLYGTKTNRDRVDLKQHDNTKQVVKKKEPINYENKGHKTVDKNKETAYIPYVKKQEKPKQLTQKKIEKSNLENKPLKLNGVKKQTIPQTAVKDIVTDPTVSNKNVQLLETIIHAMDQNNLQSLEEILKESAHHLKQHYQESEKLGPTLNVLLDKMFANKSKYLMKDNDETFAALMQFMIDLKKILRKEVKQYLQRHHPRVINNVLRSGSSQIIIEFLRLCIAFELKNLVSRTLEKMLSNNGRIIRMRFNTDEIHIIFWYAYLVDIDVRFLNEIGKHHKEKLEKMLSVKAYFYVDSVKKGEVQHTKVAYRKYKNSFSEKEGLTKKEKQQVLQKLTVSLKHSTHVSKNKSPRTQLDEQTKYNGQIELKETSELRSVGYKITGLNRTQRWRILEKAVQMLGLYKVSYTIANHIRLRKGQKNGPIKFKHAITEWEHDLEKLKRVYYRNDFRWPKT